MLVLLPPSESKRPGGDPERPLDLDVLAFPALTDARRLAIDALERLAEQPDAAAAALKLGPRLRHEVEWNRRVRSAPTLPAIDRYDGVLYDALDAASLPSGARTFAGRHVAIASALFGLTGALDPIPAYRLSAGSRLPAAPLKPLWRAPLGAVLADLDGLVVDLRSADYAALGPLAPRAQAVTVRVLAEEPDGRRRALNHFNKHGKGEFVRELLLAGVDHTDVGSLLDWAAGAGIRLEPADSDGVLDLVV